MATTSNISAIPCYNFTVMKILAIETSCDETSVAGNHKTTSQPVTIMVKSAKNVDSKRNQPNCRKDKNNN